MDWRTARLQLAASLGKSMSQIGNGAIPVIRHRGGIDSAVSCALAAEALGPDNVLAICMPYKTSSPDSLEDAQKTADCLKVQMQTIEITAMVDPLIERESDMSKVRKGNLMARARMIVLYDQSEVFKGLVIGTSNKTEILLGYTTMWGDMATAINPTKKETFKTLYEVNLRRGALPCGTARRAGGGLTGGGGGA